jgi:cytochrome P450
MLARGAGNRDGRQSLKPYEFRLDRANAGKHLSFGSGPRRCVGAPLAQVELEAITYALLDAGELTLTGPLDRAFMARCISARLPFLRRLADSTGIGNRHTKRAPVATNSTQRYSTSVADFVPA